MSFIIREARKEDAAKIHELIYELAEFEKLAHEVEATPESIEASVFAEGAAAKAIVGEENGEVVSFALYFHSYSTFLAKEGLYLEDLYVKADRRGKGYGRKLLSHLAKIAKEQGLGRMEWSVLNWNEGAIRLYEKLGAKAQKEWTVYRLQKDGIESLSREAE